MTYPQAVEYLYGLQFFGIKMGLDNIRRLCAELGNPQDEFDAVHVAGTNGKGSTCAMIESVLRAAGIPTGLYTSPHLVDFTERIQVCGRLIEPDAVAELTGRLRPLADELKATFFEVTTAMAFAHFAVRGVRLAVIETGLGGRLDATSVIRPSVSVITPISLDHMEHLGGTLAEIAAEKAGILKPNTPAVFAVQEREARQVLWDRARKFNCPVSEAGVRVPVHIRDQNENGLVLDVWRGCAQQTLALSLPGQHQAGNAAIAMATLEELHNQGFGISPAALKRGLAAVRWPGRFQVLRRMPRIVLDVAHNPAGAAALVETCKACFPGRKTTYVLGIMADKDYPGFLRAVGSSGGRIILCRPKIARSADTEALARAGAAFDPEIEEDVGAALDRALRSSPHEGVVVVSGSFHTVGEAMEKLGLEA